MKRTRRTPEERAALALESLHRAQNGSSSNDTAVIVQFAARGIDATPRVDVFTYRAWQAAGRQVRRGERGERIIVWIPVAPSRSALAKDPKASGGMMPKSTTVFHISQTDPIGKDAAP